MAYREKLPDGTVRLTGALPVPPPPSGVEVDPVHMRRTTTTAQSFPTSVTTIVTWPNLIEAYGDITYNATTGVFTVVRTGLYHIACTIAFEPTAGGRRTIALYKNGVGIATNDDPGSTTQPDNNEFDISLHMVEGDTFDIRGYQNSGGAVALTGNGERNRISVTMYGGPAGADGTDGVDGTDGTRWGTTGTVLFGATLANAVVDFQDGLGPPRIGDLVTSTNGFGPGDVYKITAVVDATHADLAKITPTHLSIRGPQGPVGPQGPTGAAGATGSTGAQGIQGTQGPVGTAGSKWLSGAGAPAGATGVVTDWYLNTSNGDVYEKTGASTWTLRDNITGPQGPQGIQGIQGAQGIQGNTGSTGATGTAGSKWLSGAGIPASGTGVVTDWYLNTSNGDVYEKTGASAWTLRDNLQGPQGTQGIQGIQGPKGDPGSVGNVWPIDSVYISFSSANPGSILGGTWISIGSGRMLIGVDSGDAAMDAAGDTGGTKTNTLTEANLPPHDHAIDHNHAAFTTASGGSHDHSLSMSSSGTGGGKVPRGGTTEVINTNNMFGGDTGATHTHSIDVPAFTGASGNGDGTSTPVNNLSPYLAVYMWRRTA